MRKNCGFFVILSIILIGIYSFIQSFSEEEKYIVSKAEENITNSQEENLQEENLETEYNKSKEDELKKEMITIFISGEVKNSDVVEIESDQRLGEAINILGGLTENADVNLVNMAMKLEDGKHYVVPNKQENTSEVLNTTNNAENTNVVPNMTSNTQDTQQSESKIININQATKEELDTLPGIGPSTADKIINYREEHKKFNNIEEIQNVSGIGGKKYEDIKDLIGI